MPLDGVSNPLLSGITFRAKAVVPSDTADIDDDLDCVALRVGTAGNVRVMTRGGDDVTFANCTVAEYLPVACTRVYATRTTASDIVAMLV